MIRSVLFGYKVNCSITLLKKYGYLLRTKTGNKWDLTKTRLGFYILNLHGTLGEVNKLSLCKHLTRVSFANDSQRRIDIYLNDWNRYIFHPKTYLYRQNSVIMFFFCFLFKIYWWYWTRIVKVKAIFQAYKYLEDRALSKAERTFLPICIARQNHIL